MARKLAVILAADVVGYSALMERDEEGTFARFKKHRIELLEPKIKHHGGRIFKRMGDGLLVEFGSAVDAVECAAAIQGELARRNSAVPADQQITLRIGINLGDVIVEGRDLHGDGVNIAARLEQLAQPGSIFLSGKVAKEVEKKLPFGLESIGNHKVKNISEPVSVYRVRIDGTPIPTLPSASTEKQPRNAKLVAVAGLFAAIAVAAAVAQFVSSSASKPEVEVPPVTSEDSGPTLAVLPFANMSGDPGQSYLADGISEDLTTELARVPGLFVVSRTAAFAYKERGVAIAQIASELGVRYLLEGSLRRAGDDMRINAQLIDAKSGGHVWAERFDGAWSDVFSLQDKVIASVAKALKLRLVAGQRMTGVSGGTQDPAAYDEYLRGIEAAYLDDPQKALSALQRAIAIDPNFGMATAEIARIYHDNNSLRWSRLSLSQDEMNAQLYQYLNLAARNPSPTYYQLQGDLLISRHRKYGEAIAALEKAIALDPSDGWSYVAMAQALALSGRAADGFDYVNAAMRVDPTWTSWKRYLAGLALFGQDRFAEAAASFEKVDLQSGEFWPRYLSLEVLIAAYGHLDRRDNVAAALQKLNPFLKEVYLVELTALEVQANLPFNNARDTERVVEGLRRAGVPELPYDLNPTSKERLTGAEIDKLIFGHELVGRHVGTNNPTWSRIEPDGTFTTKIGDRESGKGMAWTEGSCFCFSLPTEGRTCAVIYRNPNGSREHSNEYLLLQPWQKFEFSVSK